MTGLGCSSTRREFLLAAGAMALTSGLHGAPFTSSSRYAQLILSRGPIGYWRLGEATGPAAADSSRSKIDGVYHGSPKFIQAGAVKGDANGGIAFSGSDSYVEMPDNSAFSQPTSGKGLTVEAWLRPDTLEFEGENPDPHIHWLGKGEGSQFEWAFRFYSRSTSRPNRISAYIWNPDGGLGSGAYFEDPIKAGEWIHVVACFDPGDKSNAKAGVSIFKNGIFRGGPGNQPGSLYKAYNVAPLHGSAPLRLGTRDRKTFLVGALDEVAIYPRVVRPAEIMQNYRAAT